MRRLLRDPMPPRDAVNLFLREREGTCLSPHDKEHLSRWRRNQNIIENEWTAVYRIVNRNTFSRQHLIELCLEVRFCAEIVLEQTDEEYVAQAKGLEWLSHQHLFCNHRLSDNLWAAAEKLRSYAILRRWWRARGILTRESSAVQVFIRVLSLCLHFES
jgi:hypothetical protein